MPAEARDPFEIWDAWQRQAEAELSWASIVFTDEGLRLAASLWDDPTTQPVIASLWEEFRGAYHETDQALGACEWSQRPSDELLFLLARGHAVVVRMDQCLPSAFPGDFEASLAEFPPEFRERPHRWFYFLSLLLYWLEEGADAAVYERATMPAVDYLAGGHARREIQRRLADEPVGRAVAGLYYAWAVIKRGWGREDAVEAHLTTLRKMIWRKVPDWQKLELVGAQFMDHQAFQKACRELDSQIVETLARRFGDHDVIALIVLALEGKLRIFTQAVADDIKDRIRWWDRRWENEAPSPDGTEEDPHSGETWTNAWEKSPDWGPEQHAYYGEMLDHLRQDRRYRRLVEIAETGGAKSLTEMANQLNVSRQTVWKWGTGLRKWLHLR